MKEFSAKYLSLLKGPLAGLNLTNILDETEFYQKQILDSVLPLEKSEHLLFLIEKYGVLVDVGFGGGFPLVPLAHKLPHIKCIGIEAREKKVAAVKTICDEFKLSSVKLAHMRLEELLIDCPAVVTFKAVGNINELLNTIKTSTVEVAAFFYKGPSFQKELQEESKAPSDWSLLEAVEFELASGDKRALMGFVQQSETLGTKHKNDKNLVNLTDII